jgi:hypothetical protein
MNEDEMRDVFRELRGEPVPADSLARVRVAVDQRIHPRPWWSAWKLAVPAIAGCVVAGFLWLKPVRPIQPVSQPEIAQVFSPAVTPALPEVPARPAPRPKRARPRPVAEGVPVSIRIETPDPDVVILLVN